MEPKPLIVKISGFVIGKEEGTGNFFAGREVIGMPMFSDKISNAIIFHSLALAMEAVNRIRMQSISQSPVIYSRGYVLTCVNEADILKEERAVALAKLTSREQELLGLRKEPE